MAHLQHLLLVVEALLLLFHVLATAADLLLTLVEVELALLQSVLTLLDALVALLHLLLQLTLLVEEFLLHLQELLLLHYLGVLARLVHHLLILSLENISENSISDAASDCQSHDCNDYFYHVLMLFFFLSHLVRHHLLDLLRQLGDQLHEGLRVVERGELVGAQRQVEHGHVHDVVVGLLALIDLGIGVDRLRHLLGRGAVVLLLLAGHVDHQVGLVQMELDTQFLFHRFRSIAHSRG